MFLRWGPCWDAGAAPFGDPSTADTGSDAGLAIGQIAAGDRAQSGAPDVFSAAMGPTTDAGTSCFLICFATSFLRDHKGVN